jgi:hypothetical protein
MYTPELSEVVSEWKQRLIYRLEELEGLLASGETPKTAERIATLRGEVTRLKLLIQAWDQ